MSESASPAQIAAAKAYEELMVPALFGRWAEAVVEAAEVKGGEHVLDVACGTGVVARAALVRVGAEGAVAALDPDAGMLQVAGDLAPQLELHQGLADALPMADESFDVVLSQFGLMFFPDRGAAVREMLRVLRPDGRLAVAVWDGLERQPAYAVEVDLLERLAGREAADAVRAPFVLGDAHALARIFEDAGARQVAVRTGQDTGRFPSVRAMVTADLRGWLPIMGVELPEDLIARILDEAESALAPFVTADGRVAFDSQAHIVSARR